MTFACSACLHCETGNIKFTDLNDADYKPEENGGIGFEEGMKVRVRGEVWRVLRVVVAVVVVVCRERGGKARPRSRRSPTHTTERKREGPTLLTEPSPHPSWQQVIHAVLPDGSTVKGVEVFRRVYECVGRGRFRHIGPTCTVAPD